jgi:hypothetical protein
MDKTSGSVSMDAATKTAVPSNPGGLSPGTKVAVLLSMRRTFFFVFTGWFLLVDLQETAAARESPPSLLGSGQTLIRQRRSLPDDPLAGLPTEAEGGSGSVRPGKSANKGTRACHLAYRRSERSHRGKTSNRAARTCHLETHPASSREVGDLRATLAFVLKGPEKWPCPSRIGRSAKVRLRISVADSGRITDVQPAGGHASIAAALSKELVGRSIEPRPEGATEGTVVLRFETNRK